GFGGSRWPGFPQGGNVRGREILEPEPLAVTSLEAMILFDRDHHRTFAAVTGYRHRLYKSHILVATDVALKLRRRNFDHAGHISLCILVCMIHAIYLWILPHFNTPPPCASDAAPVPQPPSAGRTCRWAACRKRPAPRRSSPRRHIWRSCRTG